MTTENATHEQRVLELKDDAKRQAEFERFSSYQTSAIPLVLAKMLFATADLVYGKAPSYQKFYVIELIARVPYQSWEMWSYVFQTLVFANETRSIKLAELQRFSRLASDNETMHVVVIGTVLNKRPSLMNLIFSFSLSLGYFCTCFWLHAIKPAWAYELNFLFETHAYQAYDTFLKEHEAELKLKPIKSKFLNFYGRQTATEYEFIELVRNDELLHRNASLAYITAKS